MKRPSGDQSVGAMNPLSGWFRGVRIAIHGPVQAPEKDRGISLNQVTDGFFETTGIRLLAGRLFTPRDRSGSLRVAILNETADPKCLVNRRFFRSDLGRAEEEDKIIPKRTKHEPGC